MADLWKMIKWVLLIRFQLHQMFWVLRSKEKTWAKPILIFLVRPVVALQFPVWLSPEIFKSHYLGFYSSDFKTEDSSENLSIKRIHGEKPILIFWVFHLRKSLWLFNFLEGLKSGPWPRRNFWNMGFYFFTQIFHFHSNLDRGDILLV